MEIINKSSQIALRMAKFIKKQDERQKESDNELTQLVQELMSITIDNSTKIDTAQDGINTINETLKVTAIDRFEVAELDNLMKERIFNLVGAINSDDYIIYFAKYKSILINEIKREYGTINAKLMSIKDLKKTDFESAKNDVKSWNPSRFVKRKILDDWQRKIEKQQEGGKQEISQRQIDAFYNVINREIKLGIF
ncbi:hypothetical protein [Clostridium perfringens]|uniref:hypothetical protein n=1 Tax=Clostridium perfringens TaxID=1502 RepID=UPI002340FDD4|nr:hypothetical protein [Clostridium perfringens]MDC4245545.1 hypothetical protein [Clostridium perfringens]